MKSLRSRIIDLLARVGPENIWRPVVDADGTLLAPGHEDMRDGAPEDLARVDCTGRHILDLGCNFGYYSFLVKRMGAQSVLGIDLDPDAVLGCRLLAELYGMPDVRFLCRDFTGFSPDRRFDGILLINYIGKRSVCKSIRPILETIRRCSDGWIILSARPVYSIERNLPASQEALSQLYGKRFIRNNRLHLQEYLEDFFSDRYRLTQLSPDYPDQTIKRTLLFSPRSSSGKKAG